MASDRTDKVVPEAKESLNKFKYEVAQDIGVKNLFIVIPQNIYNLL